jgi:hypothetical protein
MAVGISLLSCNKADINAVISTGMTDIYDFQNTQTSDHIPTLPVHVARSRNHVLPLEPRCYPIYKLRYTLKLMYFRLMAAMLDLSVTPMSESIQTNLIVLPNPENVGVAVGISLLSHIQAKINVTAYVLPVNDGHA